MSKKRWRVAEPTPEAVDAELGQWPQPLRQLLFNRGILSAEEAEHFFYPERSEMHDPFLLKGMDAAVNRVFRALREEQLIAVYGDFDVDGLTAAALLIEVLQAPGLQGRVVPYLPHRAREGYGLNLEAVRQLAQKGVGLLITVDCGVGADKEIKLAETLGIDVIVTDHHQISNGLPPALAVINPRQEGCSYPFKELAGVGVAYKLAEALLSHLWGIQQARTKLKSSLDLVALGTVGDLALLLGENRLLVKLGLAEINRGERLGLRTLASAAGIRDRTIGTDSISYVLAPRLNAAGRMGDARLGLDLLLCRSEEESTRLASLLETANRDRQVATATALNTAREALSREAELPPAIVLVGDYPSGIVGLVANRLVEELHRPAFVIEAGEGECRGSGRGVPGFNVIQTLAEASDLLVRFGGHSQAAGFAVEVSHLDALRSHLECAAGRLDKAAAPPDILIEGKLKARDFRPGLFDLLALLEPYGVGNQRPIFCSQGLQVRDVRVVGSGHLRMTLLDETGTVGAIGFGMASEEYSFARPGARIDCAYTVARNERGGTFAYEMVLKDMRLSD
ncbi:MAG: single-stranded-DNA-specific exonuclease RecJ [Chloroflexota bacterium]|jgi:single-stranded-DNA-specific exonuclease